MDVSERWTKEKLMKELFKILASRPIFMPLIAQDNSSIFTVQFSFKI